MSMTASVYLDWNATAPLDTQVFEAMRPWLQGGFGNASSQHSFGRRAHAAIEAARAQVAGACGAHAGEVIFTSGGSEANNLFIKGAAVGLKAGTLAVSAVEHPSVYEPAGQLRRQGWRLEHVGVDENGRVDVNDWGRALAERPQLVSVMLANNECGVLQDIAPLAREAACAGAWFHTDAVQALGRVALDFRSLGVQAMTISSHKIGGPLGVGALIVDKRVEVAPLIAGGGQERNLRSGTENVPAIIGFGVACEIAVARMQQESVRLQKLRGLLEARLRAQGCRIFSADAPRLPNTVFFAAEGIDGATMVSGLDRAGFACASGSACSSSQPGASRTLLAMGVPADIARDAVRVSLGRDTSEEDISRFAASCDSLRRQLKAMTAVMV